MWCVRRVHAMSTQRFSKRTKFMYTWFTQKQQIQNPLRGDDNQNFRRDRRNCRKDDCREDYRREDCRPEWSSWWLSSRCRETFNAKWWQWPISMSQRVIFVSDKNNRRQWQYQVWFLIYWVRVVTPVATCAHLKWLGESGVHCASLVVEQMYETGTKYEDPSSCGRFTLETVNRMF